MDNPRNEHEMSYTFEQKYIGLSEYIILNFYQFFVKINIWMFIFISRKISEMILFFLIEESESF